MQIAVTTTMPGSPDGIRTNVYEAGQSYDMPDDLAAVFVREKWGAEPKPAPKLKSGPDDNKSQGAAPETK